MSAGASSTPCPRRPRHDVGRRQMAGTRRGVASMGAPKRSVAAILAEGEGPVCLRHSTFSRVWTVSKHKRNLALGERGGASDQSGFTTDRYAIRRCDP